MVDRQETREARRHEADYIDRTILTVRNHREADNCWPQWANIFADEIEDLRAERDRLAAEVDKLTEALRSCPCNCQHIAKKQTYECRRCRALDRLAAEVDAQQETLREKAWPAVENLRGYQAMLSKPREGEDEATARMRGQHFGAHIDAILAHLRAALAAVPSSGGVTVKRCGEKCWQDGECDGSCRVPPSGEDT